mmetsp:Transcript_17929/g.34273  ORF Transcript_17929/g.34273 Transcript_17929/m.34273 type:complete len:436 (+) Transcript_17929:79-1386(+)
MTTLEPEGVGKEGMRLCVRTLKSTASLGGVKPGSTLENLKQLLHTTGAVDLSAPTQHIVFQGIHLTDNAATIEELGLHDGGTVVVLERRNPPPPEPVDNTPDPTQDVIAKYVPSSGGAELSRNASSPNGASLNDIESQLRSLLNAMASLNGLSGGTGDGSGAPLAELDANGNRSTANNGNSDEERPAAPDPSQGGNEAEGSDESRAASQDRRVQAALANVDADALEQILEMGFSETRARKALVLHRNYCPAAMEWLLEVSDTTADAPLSQDELRQVGLAVAPRGRAPSPRAAPPTEEPDPAVLLQLTDMGFSAEDVAEAMRVCGNNHEAACAWLLGDRDHSLASVLLDQMALQSGEDAGEESGSALPLLQNILSHPEIQESMQSEHVVQAFQQMISNPETTHEFLTDPEVGPVLMQVHRLLSRTNNGVMELPDGT